MTDSILNLTQIQQTLQNVVIAINNLTTKLGQVFPQGSAVSHSATAGTDTLPAAPAGFLTINLPDGTVGKVPYYNV